MTPKLRKRPKIDVPKIPCRDDPLDPKILHQKLNKLEKICENLSLKFDFLTQQNKKLNSQILSLVDDQKQMKLEIISTASEATSSATLLSPVPSETRVKIFSEPPMSPDFVPKISDKKPPNFLIVSESQPETSIISPNKPAPKSKSSPKNSKFSDANPNFVPTTPETTKLEKSEDLDSGVLSRSSGKKKNLPRFVRKKAKMTEVVDEICRENEDSMSNSDREGLEVFGGETQPETSDQLQTQPPPKFLDKLSNLKQDIQKLRAVLTDLMLLKINTRKNFKNLLYFFNWKKSCTNLKKDLL